MAAMKGKKIERNKSPIKALQLQAPGSISEIFAAWLAVALGFLWNKQTS